MSLACVNNQNGFIAIDRPGHTTMGSLMILFRRSLVGPLPSSAPIVWCFLLRLNPWLCQILGGRVQERRKFNIHSRLSRTKTTLLRTSSNNTTTARDTVFARIASDFSLMAGQACFRLSRQCGMLPVSAGRFVVLDGRALRLTARRARSWLLHRAGRCGAVQSKRKMR